MEPSKNGVSYTVESGESASGNAQRVTNLFTGFDSYLASLKEKLEDKKMHLSLLQKEIKADNPYQKQVNKLEREVRELREKIED